MQVKITRPDDDIHAELIKKVVDRQMRMHSSQSVVQIDPAESECLEIVFLNDPAEVVVLRHGMNYPEGGEAVYSELIDPGD